MEERMEHEIDTTVQEVKGFRVEEASLSHQYCC